MSNIGSSRVMLISRVLEMKKKDNQRVLGRCKNLKNGVNSPMKAG